MSTTFKTVMRELRAHLAESPQSKLGHERTDQLLNELEEMCSRDTQSGWKELWGAVPDDDIIISRPNLIWGGWQPGRYEAKHDARDGCTFRRATREEAMYALLHDLYSRPKPESDSKPPF